LMNGVALYGGFTGTETMLSERDWVAHVTILSGDIGAVADITDNSCHVVTGSGTDSTAVIDGFTVTKGYPLGSGDGYGAGMYNESGNPTVRNAIFLENLAGYGGGLYNVDSSPMLTNVTFSGNRQSFNFIETSTILRQVTWYRRCQSAYAIGAKRRDVQDESGRLLGGVPGRAEHQHGPFPNQGFRVYQLIPTSNCPPQSQGPSNRFETRPS
jgi:hypothetical protein